MPIFSAMVRIATTARSDGLAGRFRILGRLAGDLLGLGGVVGVLLDVGGHLFHRGRSLFGRSGLFGRALGQLSPDVADISWLPAETLCDAERASVTTVRRRSTMRWSARPSVSLSDSGLGSTVRSPAAI